MAVLHFLRINQILNGSKSFHTALWKKLVSKILYLGYVEKFQLSNTFSYSELLVPRLVYARSAAGISKVATLQQLSEIELIRFSPLSNVFTIIGTISAVFFHTHFLCTMLLEKKKMRKLSVKNFCQFTLIQKVSFSPS